MSSRFDPAADDFGWLLSHVVDTDGVLPDAFDPETVRQVVDAAAEFIDGTIAPLNAASDTIGVRLVDGRVITPPGWREAWRDWSANGWSGLGMPEWAGGQAMPFLIEAVVATMLGGADLAFAMVSASARGAASVLAAHAAPELVKTCLPRLASGEWTATIVITEAQAGSDVGLIRTKAVPWGDGRYELSGSKIFISGGDHDLTEQILHVVLARTEGAGGGVKGLSLFLVPSLRMTADGTLGARNGVSVARIEEKLGLHGSATCVLDLDRAEAWMVGAEGQGLAALFTMMNELRLEVALSAVGIAASATSHAIAYAEERLQGRDSAGKGPAAISSHPDVRRMIAVMKCLTQGGRALVLEAARLVHLERHAGTREERAAAASAVAWLLPICKAALSDMAVEVAGLSVQVRGGHGYVRESGAEQFLRDARVLPIYEGTNGIHAGTLATRGLQRDGGAAARAFAAAMQPAIAAAAERPELRLARTCLVEAVGQFEEASALLVGAGPDQAATVLSVAYDYLTLAGRVALAWMWLRMALAADADQPEKRELADFHAHHYGPEIDMLARRIAIKMAVAVDEPLEPALQHALSN